jgi:hypothetical protein
MNVFYMLLYIVFPIASVLTRFTAEHDDSLYFHPYMFYPK